MQHLYRSQYIDYSFDHANFYNLADNMVYIEFFCSSLWIKIDGQTVFPTFLVVLVLSQHFCSKLAEVLFDMLRDSCVK